MKLDLNYSAYLRGAVLSIACIAHACWAAESQQPLPQPLSLEYALSLVEEHHPDLQIYQAAQQAAIASRDLADAQNNLNIHLNGELRWIDPPDLALDKSQDDHWATLEISKTLLDFGRTRAATRAAEHNIEAAGQALLDAKQQQRLDIMQRFFDVLLADMQFRVDTEAMAIAYVDYDKIQERHKIGQRSDLQLAEAEAFYQQVLQKRRRSEAQQRLTRAKLANSLNHPTELPAALARPQLNNQRELPELTKLQEQALAQHPRLKTLQHQLNAAQAQLKAARKARAPTISAHGEVNYWQRELGSRDDHRAMLRLSVPLYQGGKVAAQITQAQVERNRLQAEMAKEQMAIHQAVLETWMELKTLISQREEVNAMSHWREMQLDRNRTLYELEFSTDFGDALVNLSDAEFFKTQTEYAIALQWAKLDALVGKEISVTNTQN